MKVITIENYFFNSERFIYAVKETKGIQIFLTGLPSERPFVYVSYSKPSVRDEAFKKLYEDVEQAIAWRK